MWQSGCGAIHEVVRGETAISGDKRVFIMFMGEYSHTIDAKGRLIIPSKFREQLGEEFVLTKGLDGCLSIYPNDEWAAFEEKLRALPLTNKNARTFSRFFVAGATSCELDKQGRILVPATLREFAGLEKDVVLTGNINRIEIWYLVAGGLMFIALKSGARKNGTKTAIMMIWMPSPNQWKRWAL